METDGLRRELIILLLLFDNVSLDWFVREAPSVNIWAPHVSLHMAEPHRESILPHKNVWLCHGHHILFPPTLSEITGKSGVHGTGSAQLVMFGWWVFCSSTVVWWTCLCSHPSSAPEKQDVLGSALQLAGCGWVGGSEQPAQGSFFCRVLGSMAVLSVQQVESLGSPWVSTLGCC